MGIMDAKPTSTTRGMLPGIPHYIDRVSAECIWKETLNKETRLYQEAGVTSRSS